MREFANLRYPLLERETQLSLLAQALDRLADGAGELVVVEGHAGIGKTALLRACQALASDRGYEVLTARGERLEMEFAFGVVRQLFDWPLSRLSASERAAALSGPAALARPLVTSWLQEPVETVGAVHAAVESRFSMLHGLYWLVANLTERGPLVVAVDDAHVADVPSLHFLAYLARRLDTLPVLVLVCARPGGGGDRVEILSELLNAPQAQPVAVGPLSPAGVATLIATSFPGEVGETFVLACHRACGGNPFLLGELMAELRAESIAPRDEFAGRVSGLRPAMVARAALLRLARLDPVAAEFARAFAVLGAGGQLRLAAELAGCDDPGVAAAALDTLVSDEVLTVSHPGGFVHPLLQDAVYESIPPARRAHMHGQAARSLAASGAATDPVAAHLLSSDPAAEPWAVEALRTAAAAAMGRGAPEPAVTYLRRAWAEPPTAERRSEVLVELAVAAAAAQDPASIDHLQRAISTVGQVQLRCRLAMLLARQLMHNQRLPEAVHLLEGAIEDLGPTSERDLALRLEAELIMMMHFDPDLHEAAWRRLDRFEPDGDPDGPGGAMLLANLAARAAFRGDPVTHTAPLAQRVTAAWRQLLDDDGGSALLAPALRTLVWCDHLDEADHVFAQVLEYTAGRGRVATGAMMLAFRSECAFRRGDVEDAEVFAREAAAVAAIHGIRLGVAYGGAFHVQALVELGRLDEARRALGPFSEREPPVHLAFNPLLYARGLLNQAEGNSAAALVDLSACGQRQHVWDCPNPAVVPWRSKAALAAAALGDHDHARALADDELALARRFGAPRGIGLALRTSGLLERGPRSLDLLAEAINTLEASTAHLELAYALVDYGTRLRQDASPIQARQPLRRGLDLASRCGSKVLASRARDELVTAGARPRRPRLSGVAALTAGELRVARLASQGLTNRHIAERLFLSTKTVAVHLTHTYQKLRISTRTELSIALGHIDES